MFKMSVTGTNTSTQEHLLLVNCVINQRLLQAAPHMQVGPCRSWSMSWTLVSYTRCWMTDHSARHVATQLTRPHCSRLCYQLDAAGKILRVHYKGIKCDDSFSLGSVSALFRWGGHFYHVCVKHFLLTTVQKLQDFPELWSQMYCHFLWFI